MNDTTQPAHDTGRIARNTLYLYIRMFLVMLVTLYTSRVVLDILGVEDYGVYNVVGGIVAFLGFFTSSLSNVTQRYLNIDLGNNDLGEASRYFSQSLLLYLMLSALLLVAGETLGVWFVRNKLVVPAGRELAVVWTFRFSLLASIIALLQIPYVSVIVARERMSIYAYIGIVEVVLKLGSVFLLLLWGDQNRVAQYAALIAGSYLVVLLIYWAYCRAQFPESRFRFCWDPALIRKMALFVGYNLFGCFFYAAGSQGNNVVLNLFFGPSVNAARAVAMQISAAVTRFSGSFVTAVKPQIIKSYAAGDVAYMQDLIRKTSLYSYLLILMIDFPILFNIGFILDIWLKKVPEYTALFSCLVVVDAMIGLLAEPLWIAANATGRIKRNQVYGRGFMLLTLPVSYFVLCVWTDPIVPFVAAIVAQLLYWGYSIYDIRLQLRLDLRRYFREVVVPVATISSSMVVLGAVECLLIGPGLVRLVVTTASIGAGTIAIAFFTTLSAAQRQLVTDRVRSLCCRR